jgi:hypothetical protein
MGLLLATGALEKDEPDAPKPRSVLQEGKDTLSAYEQLFPQEFEIERGSANRYAGLSQELVGKYGPDLTKTIRELSDTPESKRLYDELNTQASEELAAGSSLTPSMRREAEQYTRSGQAARGFGFSPNDLTQEVMTLGTAGETLKANRRQFAQGVLSFDQARNQQASGAALQSVFGQVPTPPQATPFTPYAADVANTNFNAGWTDKISTRNYNAAVNAALIGAIGQIVSSGASAGAGACWVAREVFGERSALWQLFQGWLLMEAPAWLRWLYLHCGELCARWLHDKPRAKTLVRWWMARRIWTHLRHTKTELMQ